MSDNSDAFEDRKGEMLEDEEMPTFISVSSKDISLPYGDANVQLQPIDNSANIARINRTADDYEGQSRGPTIDEHEEADNNDTEEGSIYVVSSCDEADPMDPSDQSSTTYEDEVDALEEDEEDIDDVDEIDVEDDDVDCTPDDQMLGEFSEDDIEKEDVRSDDLVLRPDIPKAIEGRKRSRSLQNLVEYRTLPRRNTFITGGNKYNHVQSKVNRYIQDLKTMNRRSVERRLKLLEESTKYEEPDPMPDSGEEEIESSQKPKGLRNIKGYAEQALKDLEIREEELMRDEEIRPAQEIKDCQTRPIANNINQVKGSSETANQQHRRNDLESGQKGELDIGRTNKLNMNGEVISDGFRNIKIPKGITVNYTPNGQTQRQNIMDVRSIGYDEYMRGSSNVCTEKNTPVQETRKSLSRNEAEQTHKLEITNIRSQVPACIELKNLQGTEATPMEITEPQEESEMFVEKETKAKRNDEALAQLALMQSQLNQKTTQCKEIREAYEKTLTENFELKQELEDLKKTLAKLTSKKAEPQLTTVAIQTEPPPSISETKEVPASDNLFNAKLSTSSMGSAISYNDHWTESAGSLPTSNGSIRPLPNLTPLSTAEDSFIGVQSSPQRTPRQPSHAFQTSSRIIKMLSSITQRKSKTDGTTNGEDNSASMYGKTIGSPGVSSLNSAINHRISNKRKASEMPDNAHFLQPSKIPHIVSGSHRMHRRSKSEFKYPGDYVKLNSQTSTPPTSNTKRTSETMEDLQNEDDAREDLDSGVKCFTYRDDENSLETSFLIQAEEEVKDQDASKDGDRNPLGVVRECGPYLLGNVEVRMTEINGTINIWGKEVSQETNVQDEPEEEVNMEEELPEKSSWGYLHKTPSIGNPGIGPMSCSTNKKLKIPALRLNDSGSLKNCPSSSAGVPKESMLGADNFKDHQHPKHVMYPKTDGNCRNCDSYTCSSRSANKFRRCSNCREDEHAKNMSKHYFHCNWDHENCNHSPCGRVSRHCHSDHDCVVATSALRSAERCSRLNSRQGRDDDILHRNHSPCFLSRNCEDENFTCQQGVRKNSVFEDDDDVFRRPSSSSVRVSDGSCRNEGSTSRSPSRANQSTDPLLPVHTHEPSEIKRRRSSGKRVRGILMDFLRGCGDCRTTNGPDNKVSPSTTTQAQVISTSPPSSLLKQSQQSTSKYGSTNNRCVHAECCTTCARRLEMASEIETQLEIFGAEMERLRSRSQAVLGMLNTLHSVDTN